MKKLLHQLSLALYIRFIKYVRDFLGFQSFANGIREHGYSTESMCSRMFKELLTIQKRKFQRQRI